MFCVSQAPQTIYESSTARAVPGTSRVVWGRLEYIKVGVLVGLATAVVQTQRTQENQLLGVSVILFLVRSSCLFFIGFSCTVSSM